MRLMRADGFTGDTWMRCRPTLVAAQKGGFMFCVGPLVKAKCSTVRWMRALRSKPWLRA